MLDRLKAAWTAGSADRISLTAAGIAHYALLALVPALGAVVLAYGIIAEPETVARHIGGLADALPQAAAELIGDQLAQVSQGDSGAQGFGLLIALGIALVGARGAASALITGLNIVFHVDQPRGFLRQNLVALAITAGGAIALAATAGLTAATAGLAGPLARLVTLALMLALAAAGAALIYRFAPGGRRPAWQAAWRGATIFAVLWLAATGAFAFYAANFASYNATYGSLGAVVALITWFWVSGFALLFGAEVTALADGFHDAP
ncbi:YihY/virulence factor BrkB family protein [Qipengyuania sp. XHP0207]|uniref:YihY/virulence factor BrkB family protein n=1 Tax=Qipengyuania sp. XHP0207 TaxID=3038078 RepID=UPI00241C902C|nr:YihY/virulence factor BrkB family protein [Qipengyuania sp. XHP0207]MDG5748106.1 YihY/virulence factor BrkB family protein [Qipengyuania sp. XHP0207]